MRGLIFIFYLVALSFFANAQAKVNPFQRVHVPDSIYLKLEEAYNKNAKNVNAGRNVFNLSKRKDFNFKNGIYSFQGQGVHFPRRIFVFNNGKLFVFENEGASNPKSILSEFLKCIDSLNLNSNQIVRYSKVISDYLQNEEGLTYGAEIKKD
jgi:hypothetical protein